jgi:MoaA/NifB/PqqE/SkfB family radical SAM enzyme
MKDAISLGSHLDVIVATAELPDTFGGKGHAKCHVAWGSAVVMGNGDVAVCCVPRTTIGNLHVNSMEEIWNGPHYQEFRKRVNSPSPPPQSDACPMMRDWYNIHSYLPFLTMNDWQHPKDWKLPITI